MILGNRKKEIISIRQQLAETKSENERLNKIIKESSVKDNNLLVSETILKILEADNIGVIISSVSDENLWLSSVAFDIMGYKKETTITIEIFKNSILPEERQIFEKALIDLNEGFKIPPFELKISRTEGETREYRLLSICIIKTPSNFACSIRDITKQEKIKKDLIRAKEKAEESEKLKNSLMTNISHDIRTPMNSIIGFSELLNIGNLPFDKRLEYVKTIKNQGTLLLKMIDDVVELTRMETGKITIKKSPCNIDLLINELLSLFNQYKITQNKENLEIKVNYHINRGLIIYTDSGRLQQLIWSLISNSIKFTEKGGIEIGYKPISDQRIEFYIKDTGISISRDQQKRILSKSLDDDESDLGFSIAKNLIKLLGGKMWIESDMGQGSTFYFTIPYEEVPESYHIMDPEEEYVIPSYNWKDKVIVVVEDDEVNFKFLEAVLEDTSAQVLHAKNGIQAIELCKSINKIDLVLMDIKMPEMDGFEATKLIRDFNKKVPIIAQTAFVLEKELQKCKEVGCNDCITKPIDIKDFFEKVDYYLKEE